MKEAGDMEPIPADRGGGLRGGKGGLPQAEAPSGHTVDGLLNGSYREIYKAVCFPALSGRHFLLV